jgi:hypothetical protein
MKHTTAMFVAVVGLGCATLYSGCRSTLEEAGLQTPAPVTSDLFITKGGGFNLQKLDAGGVELRYALWLEPRKPIEQPMKLEVTFQNPEDNDKPFVVTQEVAVAATSIAIKSPPVWGLQPAHAYEVLVRAYDSTGALLGTHRQLVQSIVDTRRLQRGKT